MLCRSARASAHSGARRSSQGRAGSAPEARWQHAYAALETAVVPCAQAARARRLGARAEHARAVCAELCAQKQYQSGHFDRRECAAQVVGKRRCPVHGKPLTYSEAGTPKSARPDSLISRERGRRCRCGQRSAAERASCRERPAPGPIWSPTRRRAPDLGRQLVVGPHVRCHGTLVCLEPASALAIHRGRRPGIARSGSRGPADRVVRPVV
jgi:hypothetical protein